jgi:DNA polymerase beta
MARKKKVVEPVKVDYKPLIMDALDVMAKQAIKDHNTFKARAYNKVIGQLKNITTPIYTIEEFNKLELEGVGKSINEKIVEIIATGQLKAANDIKENPETLLFDNLTKIYGVGPVKAKELMANKTINIKSIDDLRKVLVTNPKILNDKQTIGIKYFEDIQKRIPRAEVTEHDKLLENSFKNIYDKFVTTVVGSYRRGLESSGDVDVLVTVSPENTLSEKEILTHFKNVITSMTTRGYITDILALGDKKCMAFVRIEPDKPARRLDILYTTPEEYPYALLYFTGSDKFNIKFRRKTIEQGYSLSEHGVKKINDTAKPLTPIKTEQDIFTFFNITYVEPNNR